MIFNNCGKSLIHLDNIILYKYLGLILSPHGDFNLARQELKKIALKALYK